MCEECDSRDVQCLLRRFDVSFVRGESGAEWSQVTGQAGDLVCVVCYTI